MPQISKIRIVNFNYNDGNRFIPDELYDLASPDTGKALNTLFNLNNGGGKTVLVQLMMQPVHPKAMAGGRRIEDYFSHTGDHSYILLEWNLDGSKEKLLTGISIAASSSASTEEDKRGNSVKYYTFTTHYDTFSAYSISSLELSSNDNGNYVPAQFDYVREKAKSSRGLLTYYSSDDAVKWAEFLAEYGIFRTEWESVIEVLNKDEGGLNQYFDEAKTSDKLIAKFFIPAIEQKLMSVASQGTDCSLETMLINYAKKIMDKESVIKQRDTNKKLLEDLEGVSEISDDLYNANDAFVANVSETRGFAAALGNRMNAVNEETGRVAQEIEGQNTLITRIDHEKKSKNYYVASEKRDRVKADMEEALALLEQSKATLEAKRHEEDILQSAKLYRQIQTADGKITELKKLIEDKENHSDDAERIANLKYSVLVKAREAKSEQESIRAELEEKINQESATVKECQDAKKKSEAARDSASKRYTEAEAALNASKSNTDKRVANLQIDVIRRFTGFYAEEELEAAKSQREESKKEQETALAKIAERFEDIKKRENQIPGEIADLTINVNNVSRSLEDAESELGEYDSIFEQIVRICEKYSHESTAAFTGVLRDEIRRDIDTTEADIATKKRKLDSLKEKRKAAESGYLHILPEIMAYVNSTGLNPTTGEEYMDESLAGLRSTLESEQNSKQRYEEELAGYSCEESEYADPTLSVEILSKVRQERETYEKTRDSRQDEYTNKKGDYIAAEQEVKHAQEALAEHEGIPLPQEEIGEAFKERLSKAREEIKRLRSRLNILENEKRSLEKISYQVNSELEGYSEGIVAEGTILSANPDEQWKTLKAKLIFSKTEYTRKREELYRKIQTTVTTYKDIALAEIVGKLNAIGGMIDATEIKGDRLFTISESITAMIESIRKINSKIETDLREITNDFNDLVEQCFLQGKRVYEDLRMIASSSKAHIYDGKPQIPMLKMDLPEEMELSEEASRMSIRNEIEKGANEIKEMLVNNFEEKQIQKRAKSIVGSERLLHKYIIRETVPVKVYKIDLNVANSSYKRWEDTLTQSSGAEKFVVFFSVVLTLMNYTRSTSGIVSKEAKSVLILDNPFGKITSAHLLKPMFDIAKHFNVQLICLSDINKSDVTSCFECVIKLVIKQQALSNFEIMTHEDNERIEHGYYKIMNGQMSLF